MTSRDLTRPIRLPTRLAAGLLLALGFLFLGNKPAAADFRLCNNTSSRVGVALGYKDADGWTTEGWWNLAARSCETLLRGGVVGQYYNFSGVWWRGTTTSMRSTTTTGASGRGGPTCVRATRNSPSAGSTIVLRADTNA